MVFLIYFTIFPFIYLFNSQKVHRYSKRAPNYYKRAMVKINLYPSLDLINFNILFSLLGMCTHVLPDNT